MKKYFLQHIALLFVITSFSQGEIAEKKVNSSGNLNYLRVDPGVNKIQFNKNILNSYVKFSKGTELRLEKSEVDELKFTHEYYNVYYNNIKVLGFSYSIHGKDGLLHSIMGNYEDPSSAPLNPAISNKEALSIALRNIHAKKYFWEDKQIEEGLKKRSHDPTATYYPIGELLIIPEYNNSSINFRLCYRFEIAALEPFICEFVYVDAVSKIIYKQVSKIKYLDDVQATAQTRYSGTQTIWTNFRYSNSTSYALYEKNVSGHRIQTLNNNNSASGSNWTLFEDQDNNWTASEWNNAAKDNVALDIHWASEKCYEYFKTIFNREGYNNSTNPDVFTTNLVHYRFPDLDADDQAQSAYIRIHTSDLAGVFLFGNGDASHDQMGTLDVYAHEYGHGFWDFTVGNTYDVSAEVKEWGALQEGVSNAWAAAMEAWAAPTKNHWINGEELTYSGAGLYNLANPNLTAQPDTYQGTYWYTTTNCTPSEGNDYCGIHTNGGIIQYWFYLLSEGGNGVNDINNSYAVTGLGLTKAAQILYRAEATYRLGDYIGIGDGYAFTSARTATILAAIDLFGDNSCEVISLKNAWYAVGIGAAATNSSSYSITGLSPICTSNQYSLSGLPSGGTFTWQSSTPNIVSFNTSTSNPTTVSKTNNGITNIFASISNSSGCIIGTSPLVNAIVGMGTNSINFTQKDISCVNTKPYFTGAVAAIPLATNYAWYSKDESNPNNPFVLKQSENSNTADFPLGNNHGDRYYTIRVIATNPCGSLQSINEDGYIYAPYCSYFRVATFPNPTSGNISVTLIDKLGVAVKDKNIMKIEITNRFGILFQKKQFSKGQSTVILNLSNLRPDIYIVRVWDGSNWETTKLIKN